jgi:iduronate 2-sulfatase
VFHRAYCQEAVCAPSRLSLLTGRRPDTIEVWDLSTHFRKAMPDVVTLPQAFKHAGYTTRSIGKILHGSGAPAKDSPSWSVAPVLDTNRDPELRYALAENLKGSGLKRNASESAPVEDDHYIDGLIGNEAVSAIREYGKTGEPFFLAVGFKKPHLPFCAPQRYWDLYDREAISEPASSNLSVISMPRWGVCWINWKHQIWPTVRWSACGAIMAFTWASRDCGRRRTTTSGRRECRS